MAEPEIQEEIETHPLHPLYSLITEMQKVNYETLKAGNYEDSHEIDFQIFLQEQAKDRVTGVISKELNLHEVRMKDQSPEFPPMDTPEQNKYEEAWKELLNKSASGKINKDEMVKTLGKLFETWRKLPITMKIW